MVAATPPIANPVTDVIEIALDTALTLETDTTTLIDMIPPHTLFLYYTTILIDILLPHTYRQKPQKVNFIYKPFELM